MGDGEHECREADHRHPNRPEDRQCGIRAADVLLRHELVVEVPIDRDRSKGEGYTEKDAQNW